jgi:GNAT superfamily N-acetyltransferase
MATKDDLIIRTLPEGLVLRRSCPEDCDAVAAFNREQFNEEGAERWTRALFAGLCPGTTASDFLIIEDTTLDRIVSTLVLLKERWAYGGVEFGFGRPELVATHPDYRRRGLIRHLFHQYHLWSAESGHLVEGITGILNFYRQFDYEYALALDSWWELLPSAAAPLQEGQEEPFHFRPAVQADLPIITRLAKQTETYGLVARIYDDAFCAGHLVGSLADPPAWRLRVIERTSGEPVGALRAANAWGRAETVDMAELLPGTSWLEVAPSLLRHLKTAGLAAAESDPKQPFESLRFRLPLSHPLFEILKGHEPHINAGCAWYLRVHDLPRFLLHIKPVLEARLAASAWAGWSGDLVIGQYRTGLKLTFTKGALASVEAYRPVVGQDENARFPELTFLQLLFGYRSLSELERAFADVSVSGATRGLIETLFPKSESCVLRG